MKKQIFAFFVLFVATSFTFSAYAQKVQLSFQVQCLLIPGDDNDLGEFPRPRNPFQEPCVWQNGHTLVFDAAIEGCIVQLVDENEDVVFSDSIEENQTSLVLPSTLTGTYELQIIQGDYMFYCEIEL